MAKLSADKTYVTVERGDTLSEIARDYAGGASKYKQLAAINNISNPNLIYVGQKIKLTGSGSSPATSSSSNKPTIKHFGLLSTSDNTLFATWDWGWSKTASYKVLWTYDTGDGVWFDGSNSPIDVDKDAPELSRQSTYTIPSNAKSVRFKVKPISEKKTVNKKEVNEWDANWSDVQTWTDSTPLATPSIPSVEIEKYKLTASLDNLDIIGATDIEFQVVKNNSANTFATNKASIVSRHASHVFTVDAGAEYKVRCRAYNSSTKAYSDWSDYSANKGTMPATPSGITTIRASSKTSVYLEWNTVQNAETYDVEYATKKDYFDNSDQTTTKTEIEFNHYDVSGLETGYEYFFRVRATNSDGSSGWSELASVVIGDDPAAPTTWSSTTTVIVGEPLNLYWVHNSADGSSQTYAELELYINGVKETKTIENTKDEDEKDKTSVYSIDTSAYAEGSKIQWRVRTAGVTMAYGDWSIQRTVDIFAPATLELRMTDVNENAISTLTSFPFYIYGLAGPTTQAPIGYHLTVVSNEIYETVDNMGNPRTVNAGEQVYSKYFDVSQALLVEFSANNIDLENNISYTVICTVSMNSGLTAEKTLEFTVTWEDKEYEPSASIGVDMDTLTAYIRPYCDSRNIVNRKVVRSGYYYTLTDEDVGSVYGETLPYVKTATGEQVYSGVNANGEDVLYCTVVETVPVENVWLSVYRREFDGSFTELATNLDGAKYTTVTDPHPALDYARYRIVATSKTTGAVSFYDPPGYPVGGTAVVIQWAEEWTNFETKEGAEMEQPPWSGSLLKLPYNIDVSDTYGPDVSRVEYIGRSHPIVYYGTQLGQTATWAMEIEANDEETLYALRRLARWMGDAYVREPSGSGYWANVAVSFNQKHLSQTIPVTLNIVRVEGGA